VVWWWQCTVLTAKLAGMAETMSKEVASWRIGEIREGLNLLAGYL
jgi:hypothetical protein